MQKEDVIKGLAEKMLNQITFSSVAVKTHQMCVEIATKQVGEMTPEQLEEATKDLEKNKDSE